MNRKQDLFATDQGLLHAVLICRWLRRLLLIGLVRVLSVTAVWFCIGCMHGIVGCLLARLYSWLVNVAQLLRQHVLFLLWIVVFAVVFTTDLALVNIGTQCNFNAL